METINKIGDLLRQITYSGPAEPARLATQSLALLADLRAALSKQAEAAPVGADERAAFEKEFPGADENYRLGGGEYWGPYYSLRWGQWRRAWQAALAQRAGSDMIPAATKGADGRIIPGVVVGEIKTFQIPSTVQADSPATIPLVDAAGAAAYYHTLTHAAGTHRDLTFDATSPWDRPGASRMGGTVTTVPLVRKTDSGRDAARYSWLKECNGGPIGIVAWHRDEEKEMVLTEQYADEAIDAAMAAQQGEKPAGAA